MSTGRKSSTRRTLQALYAEALALMRDECASDVTLEHVARRIATSPRQLQRAFDEAGAPPFQQLLIRVRLERAKELLRDPEVPIYEIAAQVGYQRQSSFAKAFRRAYDITPAEYRAAATAG